MDKDKFIADIERKLSHHLKYLNQGVQQHYLQPAVRSKSFKDDEESADCFKYQSSAEHSYGVARLLFQLRITWYAHFCAQQCIECYFKAYIKSRNKAVPMTHSLEKLLDECSKLDYKSSFFTTDYAKAVILKFDAFNEFARYPVLRVGPDSNCVSSIYPDDMMILDYCVYQIRKLLPPTPQNKASLFTRGHIHLGDMRNTHPEAYKLILKNNINFN